MNRKDRRAAGLLHADAETQLLININAAQWAEIKRIKRDYDAMTPEQQAERKPAMAAQIDGLLAELKAGVN